MWEIGNGRAETDDRMSRLFSPLARSVAQITDPAFLGVLAISLVCSAAVFALLHLGVLWAVHRALALHGWVAWLADVLGGIGAWLLGLWLFLPLAAGIATLFIDRVARAVERRWYHGLPPAPGASLLAELLDGLALMWRILLLSLLALVLAVMLPGIGLLLAWAIGAYAIGRGLFVTVALRRLDRVAAERLYAANRPREDQPDPRQHQRQQQSQQGQQQDAPHQHQRVGEHRQQRRPRRRRQHRIVPPLHRPRHALDEQRRDPRRQRQEQPHTQQRRAYAAQEIRPPGKPAGQRQRPMHHPQHAEVQQHEHRGRPRQAERQHAQERRIPELRHAAG